MKRINGIEKPNFREFDWDDIAGNSHIGLYVSEGAYSQKVIVGKGKKAISDTRRDACYLSVDKVRTSKSPLLVRTSLPRSPRSPIALWAWRPLSKSACG